MISDSAQSEGNEPSFPREASGYAPDATGAPHEANGAVATDVANRGASQPAKPDARLRRLGKRLLVTALAFGLIALILVAAHRPLLTAFALRFRVDDPAPSDAVVMLIGGFDHRPGKVVELYRKGIAPVVLMGKTETDLDMEFNEAKICRNYLIRKGIPAEAVQLLPGDAVTSTHDEALRLRDYARTHPLRRVTIVTTAFHTARARWVFRRVLQGQGVEVRMAAARHRAFDETNWYRDESGLISYFEELIKTVYYHLNY